MMRIGVVLTTLLLHALSVVFVAVTAADTSDNTTTNPSEYFGGSDHESYLQWYNSNGTSYTGCMFLEANGGEVGNGMAVHWRVNETEELLYLSFAARAQDGWIALGMAESGSMPGSDIVIYETSKPNVLTDAYVLRENFPLIDDCQDWQLVSSVNDGGFLIVEGIRRFDTNDTQDRYVIYDAEEFMIPQRIIAAWGSDTGTIMYHGADNRARGALRWFGTGDEKEAFHQEMMVDTIGYIDLSFGNYSIKTDETEYVNFCFDWDTDIVPQGLPSSGNVAMIAVDVMVDPMAKPFLHHVIIFGKRKAYNQSGVCQGYGRSTEQLLYSWTFGSLPLRVPEDTGFNLGRGDTQGFESFRGQVHYNNPDGIDGMRDNSKIRIYYTTTKPKYEVGVILMADYEVHLENQTINAGLSKHTFECGEKCSSIILDEPVTVFAELFHMHLAGSAGVQHQIRDGEIIRQSNVDFFDFNAAGIQTIRQRPFQIITGDSFSTSCFYDSNNLTLFGKKSSEEMCFVNLLYYPAKTLFAKGQWACGYDVPVAACNAAYSSDQYSLSDSKTLSSLEIDAFYERQFGSSGSTGQCGPKPSTTVATSTSSTFHEPNINIFILLFSATTIWRIYAMLG